MKALLESKAKPLAKPDLETKDYEARTVPGLHPACVVRFNERGTTQALCLRNQFASTDFKFLRYRVRCLALLSSVCVKTNLVHGTLLGVAGVPRQSAT